MGGVAVFYDDGGTDVYEALRESFRAIRGVEAGVRHVILLSDGHTPGSLFRSLVTGAAADKVTLTTVGIGDGADIGLLRKLADWGRGAFRFAQRCPASAVHHQQVGLLAQELAGTLPYHNVIFGQ